jgi:hypothetical protein
MSDASRTLTITVPDGTAEEFERLTEATGCSAGELFQEMLQAYEMERERGTFHELRRYGVEKARELGVKDEEDVYRLVQEFRQEEREREVRERGDPSSS